MPVRTGVMAMGEQIILDSTGPQFNYEIVWDADGSSSTVRAEHVATKLRPDGPLGTFSDRSQMTGLDEYEVGAEVRSLYDGDWLKATVESKTKVAEAELPPEIAEDPTVKRLREQEAAKAAERVSCHDIAGIWVAFFQECQQYRCGQGGSTLRSSRSCSPARRPRPPRCPRRRAASPEPPS